YLGLHNTEAYAPLHHQDQKHFLRLHIGADGSLTIYPVGIERVGRKWVLRPDAPADAPWFAPEGAEIQTHLIEPPIRIGGPAPADSRELRARGRDTRTAQASAPQDLRT
ncbi:MAG: hypothetical protein LC720_07305, partial [Actinobacteria bacterium]|nr:hypothetical protein [Actinomycetota bacterium]